MVSVGPLVPMPSLMIWTMTSCPRRRHFWIGGRSRRGVLRPTSSICPHAVGEILRLQVGDVQEAVLGQAEVDERRLDARLDVGHAALVDVADVRLGAGPLDEQLLEPVLVQDGDAALLALGDVDQHDAFARADRLPSRPRCRDRPALRQADARGAMTAWVRLHGFALDEPGGSPLRRPRPRPRLRRRRPWPPGPAPFSGGPPAGPPGNGSLRRVRRIGTGRCSTAGAGSAGAPESARCAERVRRIRPETAARPRLWAEPLVLRKWGIAHQRRDRPRPRVPRRRRGRFWPSPSGCTPSPSASAGTVAGAGGA